MAVIFMDGFDHYSTEDNTQNTQLEQNGWTNATLMTSIVKGSRYSSYEGFMIKSTSTGGQTIFKSGLPLSANTVLGYAYYEYGSWGTRLCTLYDGTGSYIVSIHTDSSGYLRMYSDFGSTLITGPSIEALVLSRWYYFELVKTATTVELLVDGERWLYATGLSLATTGQFTIEVIDNGYLDDVYITNDSTPLDAPRIITLYPNEDGTQTDWVGTYRDVEAYGGWNADIDDSYIETSTPLDRESWEYNELPPGSWDVHAIRPALRIKNNGAGSPLVTVTCSTGAETTGIAPSNTYTHTEHIENDATGVPSTGWTAAQVNGLELIVEYE